MNIAKNMEFIFVAAIALATVTGVATASVQAPKAIKPVAVELAQPAAMTVVTVTAKRLTAAEKAALKG